MKLFNIYPYRSFIYKWLLAHSEVNPWKRNELSIYVPNENFISYANSLGVYFESNSDIPEYAYNTIIMRDKDYFLFLLSYK